MLAHAYHHLHGLPVAVIRPFTVYGPRGRPDMASWLFIESALAGRPIRKFGDGTSRRDYTYIDDFVRGFVVALDRPRGFEIFNLGKSATVSLDVIRTATGRELVIEQLPPQPGDVDVTIADISKARRLLDFDPATPFAEGRARFCAWFRAGRRRSR